MTGKKVLIIGAEFNNQGAYLMLRAVAQGIRQHLDGTPVLEHTVGNKRQKRAVGALGLAPYKLTSRITNRWIQQAACNIAGVLSVHDIDVVLDASGFRYGDQWRSLDLALTAERLEMFSKLGVPVYMLPQAFGPFDETRDISGRLLESSRLVFARDPQSAQYLTDSVREKYLKERIRTSPDFTGPLKGSFPSGYSHLSGAVPIIPNWNIVERATSPEQVRNYKLALAGIADAIRDTGARAYGLSHEGPRDSALLAEIAQLTRAPFEVVNGLDGLSSKGLIGSAPLVISGRYHAISSALSQGIPVVAHGWSHKYRWLLDDYRVEELLVDPYAPPTDQIARAVNLLSDRRMRERIAVAGEQVALDVDAMWGSIREELEEQP
ncbi:polysaccharide pyruvyl transferase family protein [Paenarthrobacter nitroguajacolicus]|uniref:polysaccharide pyruvyl transferase family protein n=1 Tax=Paenarthrobacter nitroguajacolicus TaxID=211146 RepID=UPI00248CF5F1|nr:polysaccharide pyruvyl transferase family protein [Paenarthrobacter nitroguajacolicus]MDI2035765.1 hypothetical protein [Paenarthrobacter nitroguajacolicus]